MFRSLFSGRFPNSRRAKRDSQRARKRLGLESLERRELMAGDLPSLKIDNFLPQGSINGLYDNHVVLAGDFDKNGFADVLYIHKQSGQNRLVLNQGNGQFSNRDDSLPRGLVNGLYDNHVVLAGDFDKNGYADVLYVHKESGQNRLILNQGNGQFSIRDDFLPRGYVNGLYDNNVALAGDFDKNGFADVLYLHKESGQNRLVLNQGNGQFSVRDDSLPRGFVNGLYDNHVVLAGDFDRNGYADVLYVHKESGQNRLVLNQGNGRFSTRDNLFPQANVNQLYNAHFAIAGDFHRVGNWQMIYLNKQTGAKSAGGPESVR
jgi:hypothetical protein